MSQGKKLILLFISISLLVVPVFAVTNIINPGDSVFIGEEGLDLSAAVPAGYYQIAWFSPGTNPATGVPSSVVTIGNKSSYYISPQEFFMHPGQWLLWNRTAGPVAFYIQVPSITLHVWE